MWNREQPLDRRTVLCTAMGGLVALAGCTNKVDPVDGSTETSDRTRGIPGSEGALKLESKNYTVEGEGDFQTLTLTGRVRNISGEIINYAQIEARFEDSSGAILETSLDNITDLQPDQVWQFRIMYPGDPPTELDSAKIVADTLQY